MTQLAQKIHRWVAALALLCAVVSVNAYPVSYYASNSMLSSGTWIRISVQECGVYQLTYEQLRALGFPAPENVYVYGYGANSLTDNTFSPSLPDDLMPTATYHTSDGRILFYAEAQAAPLIVDDKNISIRRNMYDITGSYFLSDVAPQEPIEPLPFRASASVATYQYDVQLIENDVQNPGKGGAIFHDRLLEVGETENFTYHIRDFDNSNGDNGYFRYVFAARAGVRVDMEMVLPTNISIGNSVNLSTTPVYKNNKLFNTNYGYAEFANDNINNLSDVEVTFGVTRPESSASADYMALDYAYVIYPRTSILDRQSQMIMHVLDGNASRNFSVAKATEDTQVWNIDNPANIVPYTTSYDAESHTVTCSFSRNYSKGSGNTGRIIAFNPSADFPQPDIAGYVPNQDIHGSETPEMVVITTTTLLPYAEQLAEAHRTLQGIKVNVFTQEQVFNEFSSGSRTAMAYRRLAKMYFDRDASTFRHLLLYGASTWDNRNSFERGRDLLVCYEAELERWASDSGTNFAADSYYGMLQDSYEPSKIHYGLMDINVGRIPAATEAKAAGYNKKLIDYMTNPPALSSILSGVAISDVGNRLSHITQSQEAVAAIVEENPAITMVRAHSAIYPLENFMAKKIHSLVSDALTRGAGYFTYCGHGNQETIGSTALWSKHYAESTAYTDFPIAMLATCDAFGYDRLDDGIIESMLFSRNGGVIAAAGACRSVYLEYNQNINLPFARAYAGATRGTTIGDLYRYAYNQSKENTSDESAMANTLCYNLAGDPATPVYGISNQAYITNIGSSAITASTENGSVVVAPLTPTTISGYVATADGSVDESFNGSAEIVFYEAPYSRTTDNQADDAENFDVWLDETVLAVFAAEVKNGRFQTEVTLPMAITANDVNRLVVYAEASDDVQKRACGYTFAAAVGLDPTSEPEDVEAPAILEMAVDTPDAPDGLLRSADVTLTAVINPSASGLNLSRGLISSGVRLVLDGTQSFERITSSIHLDADGLAYLSMPLTELTSGVHRLTLTVQNNVGLSDEHTISFVIAPAATRAELTVAESPARMSATLDLDCEATDVVDTRLLVRDFTGATVLSVANPTFPYAWDLRDSTGNPVPDGRYRAHVVISTETSGDVSTPALDLVVLR